MFSIKDGLCMGFEDIATLENIYYAWVDFSRGKLDKQDVYLFAAILEEELLAIQFDLSASVYIHGGYSRFIVHDPKCRVIHKATVRDRVVHRLIYNALLPVFHRRWLDCSFSCRPGFGQHRSIESVRKALRQATRNWSQECWILKCDIRKFFDSVDHHTLFTLLHRCISDDGLRWILREVIESFCVKNGCGLPIGNLTSQLFANVYMHELDWYVKQRIKHRWYARYADDFLFLCQTQEEAGQLLEQMHVFLMERLKLNLHPDKIILRKSTWGIDWLGHVLLPSHEVLRPSTRHRMMRKVSVRASLVSYNGLLQGTARHAIDEALLQSWALVRQGDNMSSVG